MGILRLYKGNIGSIIFDSELRDLGVRDLRF